MAFPRHREMAVLWNSCLVQTDTSQPTLCAMAFPRERRIKIESSARPPRVSITTGTNSTPTDLQAERWEANAHAHTYVMLTHRVFSYKIATTSQPQILATSPTRMVIPANDIGITIIIIVPIAVFLILVSIVVLTWILCYCRKRKREGQS